MMSESEKIWLTFRTIIFSPEMACLLAIPICLILFESRLEEPISNLSLSPDKLKFLSFLPAVFVGLTLKDFKGVLQPDHLQKNALLQWPDYWSLKMCYFVGLLYQVFFSIFGLSVWFVSGDTLTVYFAVALVASILGAAVSYWTILLAKAKVQEKLAEYMGKQPRA